MSVREKIHQLWFTHDHQNHTPELYAEVLSVVPTLGGEEASSALLAALMKATPNELVSALLAAGANPNAADNGLSVFAPAPGSERLMPQPRPDSLGAVERLVEAGAEINVAAPDGCVPWVAALCAGNFPVG